MIYLVNSFCYYFIFFTKILVAKFVSAKSRVQYSKEEYGSKEKEYQFSNNSNLNDDNGSSFFESNNKMNQEEGFNTFDSNNFDYKYKSGFESEDKYDVFTKNPK